MAIHPTAQQRRRRGRTLAGTIQSEIKFQIPFRTPP
jgi:hypothetical protein